MQYMGVLQVLADLHFKLLDQATSMAPSYRWNISLLFGCQDSLGKTCETSGFVQRKWPSWRLCLDVFLTLTNPMTILSFVAIFTGLGLASTGGSFMSAGALVLGIFIGSSFWLLVLCSSVDVFREKFDQCRLQWLNRISGAIITVFGLVALLSFADIGF